MNIGCIFLTLDRYDLTAQCVKQNFFNSGQNADVILIDNGSESFESQVNLYPFSQSYHFTENKGIARAINKGLELTLNYDAVVLLANDILMPEGWLKSLTEYFIRIQNTGLAGIHCVEKLPELSDLGVHECFCPFGNVLISREAINKVGGFNTDFGYYGMEDSDYAYRVKKAGLINYYIPGKSEHIGHDVGQDSIYRRRKDEGLKKAGAIYNQAVKRYDEGFIYLPLKTD